MRDGRENIARYDTLVVVRRMREETPDVCVLIYERKKGVAVATLFL